jgi:hypothetical protein
MDPTNFIRSFILALGFEYPKSMLDPAAYSKEELEEDLLDIDLDKQRAKSMVEQKGNEYDNKLDEAAEAPEWMVDALLNEADLLEQAQERGKRRGTLTIVPADIDPAFAYPVDFGAGQEYVHLDEVRIEDVGKLRFEPRDGLGDAISENQREVGEAKRR